MRYRVPLRTNSLICLLLLALVVPSEAWTSAPRVAKAEGTNCLTFAQTGKTVCDPFLSYWQGHGGIEQQGFPVSNEMQARSEVDGHVYLMQHFERAIFEYHPENPAPNDVLLQLAGVSRYREKYPQGAPGQRANTSPGSVVFSQTGHRVGGLFLDYWRAHGGLAQQGYPISDEFQEKSDADGKTYLVQYFERAAFEYHPEQPRQYRVLLSRLGANKYARQYGSGSEPSCRAPLHPGVWTGPVKLSFTTSDDQSTGGGWSNAQASLVVGCDGSLLGTVVGTGDGAYLNGGQTSLSCYTPSNPTIRMEGISEHAEPGVKLVFTWARALQGSFSCTDIHGTQAREVKGVAVEPGTVPARQTGPVDIQGSAWLLDPAYQAMMGSVFSGLSTHGTLSSEVAWSLTLQEYSPRDLSRYSGR